MRGDARRGSRRAARVRPETSVRRDRGLLGAQVRAQLGDLRRRDAAHEGCAIIAASSMRRTSNTWRASSTLGAATKAPRAGLERDQLVAAQLVQRLAHQRARDLEDVGDLLLGELGAGHQAVLDDGGDDRIDDALRVVSPAAGSARLRRARCAAGRAARAGGDAGGSPAVEERLGASCGLRCAAKCIHFCTYRKRSRRFRRTAMGKLTHPRARHRQRLPGRRHGGRAARASTDGTRDRAAGARRSTPTAAPTRPLLEGARIAPGRYRLVFSVAAYFRAPRRRSCPSRRSSTRCTLDFGIADAGRALPRAAAGEPLVVLDLPRQLRRDPRRSVYKNGRLLARLGQPAAALGARHHRHRLDRRLVLLRRPRQQPDPARRPESDRAKGVGGELWAVHGGGFYHQQKYPVSPARLPEQAALVDVGELLDLAHRLRAVHGALPVQRQHLPDRQDGVRLVAGGGDRHRARLLRRLLADLRRASAASSASGKNGDADRRRAGLRLHRLRRRGCPAACSPAAPRSCSSAR